MTTKRIATIRAKSEIKIDTGNASLDYTYKKGTSMDEVFNHVAHAVVFNKGKTEAEKFFQEFLNGYEDGWQDARPQTDVADS